jgi:hypothetical protein
MRFIQSQRLVLTLIIIFLAPQTESFAAGRSTTSKVNTILNGKGAPKSSLGIDGDFYIDTRSLLIYGPKRKGKWPTPQNIQGPTGPAGNDGKNGSDGRSSSTSNVNSIAGPQGPVGPQGEKGEKGDKGDPGDQGFMGLPGAPGAMGPAGMPGATGAQGPQGVQGPVGATGATGANGIVKVIYGSLTFNDLSGSAGSGQSYLLSAFEAGKSYLVRIRVISHQPNDLTEYFLPFSLTVTGTLPGVLVHSSYSLIHGYSYRSGSSRFENSIEAEIILDGSSTNVAYGINLLITAGRLTSGSELVKFEGSFTAQEVQSTQNHA